MDSGPSWFRLAGEVSDNCRKGESEDRGAQWNVIPDLASRSKLEFGADFALLWISLRCQRIAVSPVISRQHGHRTSLPKDSGKRRRGGAFERGSAEQYRCSAWFGRPRRGDFTYLSAILRRTVWPCSAQGVVLCGRLGRRAFFCTERILHPSSSCREKALGREGWWDCEAKHRGFRDPTFFAGSCLLIGFPLFCHWRWARSRQQIY